MRYLLLLLAVAFSIPAEAQWLRRSRSSNSQQLNANGRYCNNPNCAMCNRMFGPIGGQQLSIPTYEPRIYSPTPVQQPTQRFLFPDFYQPISATPVDINQTLDPTPHEAVSVMLSLVNPAASDVVYDLGSGDGRVLITASQRYGARGVGIEINPKTAELSRSLIRRSGVGNVQIITADATRPSYFYDLREATIITMYLYPEVIEALMPRLRETRPGTKIISYNHPIPGVATTKITVGSDVFYLWEK